MTPDSSVHFPIISVVYSTVTSFLFFAEGAGRSQPANSTGFVEGQDPLALSDEPTPCIYTEEQLLEIFSEGTLTLSEAGLISP